MTKSDKAPSNDLKKKYSLDIGTFYFYEKYIVGEFKEGILVTIDNFKKVHKLALEHYNNEPYGYISNRINSYTINVLNFINHEEIFQKLIAYAIVSYNNITTSTVNYENYYFNTHRKQFKNLNEATLWVENEVVDYTK